MTRAVVRRFTRWDVVLSALVVALAYALKRNYSTASAEDLRWALGPTASLVEAMTRIHFAAERGAGFVSESRCVVIAPACSGVNYMIIALLTLTFAHLPNVGSGPKKVGFVLGAAVAAYLSMIVVNATRISLGIVVGQRLIFSTEAVRGQAHCALGVVLYLGSLALLGDATRGVVRRYAQ
jgi:exosortase K